MMYELTTVVGVGEGEQLDSGKGFRGREILQLLVVKRLQVLQVLQSLGGQDRVHVFSQIPGKKQINFGFFINAQNWQC